MANRIAFTKAGVIVQISMCDPDYCDEWCAINGYDGWVEAGVEADEPLREANEADEITGTKKAGKDKELDKTKVTVKRGGIEFVKNGARDLVKVRQLPQV